MTTGLTSRLRSSRGFTLIELLVVILIIGILIAVAAPSFLGQTAKAQDSVATQILVVAYKNAKAQAAGEGSFPATASLVSALDAAEPGYSFSAGTSAPAEGSGAEAVVVDVSSGTLTLRNRSDSGDVCTLTTTAGAYSAPACAPESSGALTYAQTVLADNPLAYWRLGASATDASGNGYTPTYNNGPASTAGAINGDSDTALDFFQLTPPNQSVTIANGVLTSTAFSIEAWIKPDTDSFGAILDATNSSGIAFIFTMAPGGGLRMLSGAPVIGANGALTIGSWNHVVVTCAGDGSGPPGPNENSPARIYVNGVESGYQLNAGCEFPPSAGPPNTLRIAYDGSNPFDGAVDEVAIYGTALSPAQILAHYNAG